MRAITIAALGLALAAACGPAAAQTFSARRMAMGGVVLGGSDGAGSNVAYRAVPDATNGARNFSLPLGLIPVLADPPQLNPHKPDFNIYDLANLLYTAPWNLQLTSPEPPSSDVVVSVSKDSLAVDLGDVAEVFPLESKIGAVVSPSVIGAGLLGAFVGLVPLVHYRNELTLNDALHAALAEGRPFVPRTDYALFDNALAQAAVGAEAGLARPLFKEGDARAGGFALYGGARVKLLRGLAYGDADNQVTFTTGDTLFTNPVDIQYVGHLREAGPGDGGFGAGLDLGAVWIGRGVEVGLGVNDIGTQIGWKVRETLIYSDPSAGGYVTQVLNDAASFTSRVPTVVTVNVAYQAGPVLIAGDVVTGSGTTQLHIGSEMWRGPWAMRAGTFVDSEQGLQGGCGAGFRLGKFGFDLALSSHSRNLSSARALELGAALSLYH
jgi:hypothetical protein